MEQGKQSDLNVSEKPKHVSGLVTLASLVGVILLVVFIFNVSEEISGGSQVVTSEEEVSRCTQAPDFLVQRLNEGLNINGGGSIVDVYVVKSSDFDSIYFVSGELQGAGLEVKGDIATFLTNRLDATGATFSADNIATEFSDWPNITTTTLLGEGFTVGMLMSSDGFQESQKCVTGA